MSSQSGGFRVRKEVRIMGTVAITANTLVECLLCADAMLCTALTSNLDVSSCHDAFYGRGN